MIIEMVFLNVFWLNAFPHKLGISQTLSPWTIVTGLGINYNKHCRIEYGQCVQTHENHNNAMTTRTIGALTLWPTGNQQGGYYFYSLMSGQWLHHTHSTELPMPAEVRDRVHVLARRANANHTSLTFTDSNGNDLDVMYPDNNNEDDDDSTYNPDQDDGTSYASSDDSTYDPTADDLSTGPSTDDNNDPPAAQPAAIAGVNNITYLMVRDSLL
jgi:hypothetical protein